MRQSTKSYKSTKSLFKYKKLCAFDRKCFTHKDKTNKMFCDMIVKNIISTQYKKILCLDSSIAKTSNMLISKNITSKDNIILIEANNSTHQTHLSNGFSCIQGNCANVFTNYYFNSMDGIYLDAIGSVETVGCIVFDAVKHIINKNKTNKCVLGYTFAKRGRTKGQTFNSTYNDFFSKFTDLIHKCNYKIIDSDSYSYGSPKTGQACMFTEFVCIEKIN